MLLLPMRSRSDSCLCRLRYCSASCGIKSIVRLIVSPTCRRLKIMALIIHLSNILFATRQNKKWPEGCTSVWNQDRSTTCTISLGILQDFLLAVTGTRLKQLVITGAKSAASKCGRDHMKWQPWCPFGGRVRLVCSPNANSSQIDSGSSVVFQWNFSTLFQKTMLSAQYLGGGLTRSQRN